MTARSVPSPPMKVLELFGARADPALLPGGQVGAWRSGDVVLKPLDMSAPALQWQADVLSAVEASPGLRVAPPLRAGDGALCVDGWTAWPYLSGRPTTTRWDEVVAAGRGLHRALVDVPRPGFLDDRTDPWWVADQIAWGERDPGVTRDAPLLRRLFEHVRPVDGGGQQVIHGDLSGNVLMHPRLPPAVIDLSPFWRPADYATALVLADALLWHRGDERVVGGEATTLELGQLLVRALIFRLVTDRLMGVNRSPSAVTIRSLDRALAVLGV